ncbi:MAG: hypothetical protein HYS53_02465 [Candidatus Aenigmarchaeota archaeon]|nr:hypothetical protein [Candidatus Aenigmarchaeota archaeon]
MKLVGTIHTDLEGPRRLRRLLDRFQPEIITVEAPAGIPVEESLRIYEERNKRNARLVESLKGPKNIKQFYAEMCMLGVYELAVACGYAQGGKAQVYGADHPNYQRLFEYGGEETFLSVLKKEFSSMDPRMGSTPLALLRARYIASVDKGYSDPQAIKKMESRVAPDAKKSFEDIKQLVGVNPEEREQFMADEIRRRKPQLHVGGIAHVFEGYQDKIVPLYLLLGCLVTERIRLIEASPIRA